MKRSVLFGLGAYFIVVVIGGMIQIFQQNEKWVGVLMMLIFMPLSVFIIRRAKAAPSNRSRLHAIIGWCLGFFPIWVIPVALSLYATQ